MYQIIKRLFDLIVAVIGLVSTIWLTAIIAVLVKVDSEGPVLHRSLRIGRYGKPFRMLKFRTMVANAEKIGGSSTAENDPRITKVGRFLRRHKFDELPQLFNVIKGEMSLVGPRPEFEEYTSMYSAEEKQILSVRPGITDLSSIKFRNLNTILATAADPDQYYRDVIRPEKNKLRLQYARTHSFGLDCRILIRTIRAVFFE